MGAYREMWKLIKQDYIVNQWIVLHIVLSMFHRIIVRSA